MATKRPKGMSSREMAAQKSGSKLNYKTGALVKPQAKVAVKKSVSPLVGAGPLMTGQSRISSQGPAIGPLLQNQSRPSSSSSKSSSSSNRSQASKAFDYSTAKSTPNSGLTGAGNTTFGGGAKTNINASLSSGGLVRGGGSKELPGGGKEGIFSRLFSTISAGQARGAKNGSMQEILEGQRRTPEQLADNRQQMASAVNYGLGVPGAMASNGEFSDFGGLQPEDQPFDYSTAKSVPSGIFGEDQMTSTPFDYSTAKSTGGGMFSDPGFDYSKAKSRGDNSNDPSIPEYTPPTQEEISQMNNEQFGGGVGPADLAGATTGNRSGRGSGMFGTGKGLSASNDDPYIKELRKAYSSNGGEKWLRKQFEELIAALDPTYAQMQKEGSDALQAQLLNQNNQLASVMNANNTGDSEQRAQLMAQQQQGTQTALGNLLAKLAQNKAQDVSGYRSQMNSALAQNADKQQSNQQRLMEQIQQYRNRQEDQAFKMRELGHKGSGSGKVSYKQVGVNSKGQPVYRDFNTGNEWVGEGLTPAMSATPQLQQDENGNWYYEQ